MSDDRRNDRQHRSTGDWESREKRRSNALQSRSRSPDKRRRSRSHERYSSRHRDGEPNTKYSRRSEGNSRRRTGDEKEKKREPYSSEEERGGERRRKFVRMEPPPGGWDKPSWEPSGALTAQAKREPGMDGGEGGRDSDRKSKEEEKEKPSFEPSGKLAEDTNTYKGVLIKYNEPPEAKIPKLRWRIYPFKGEQEMPVIYVHRQSAYLIGRDHKIADFPIEHPSCSKQHAALQYRSLPYDRPDGSRGRRTRPYIIDLGSGNGTFLNGQRIEAQRYYELKEKDVLRFGFSTREYVMLHEQSLQEANESDTSDGEVEEDEVDNIIDRTGGEDKLAKAEEDEF